MDSSWYFIPADQSAAERSNYKTAISNAQTWDNEDEPDGLCDEVITFSSKQLCGYSDLSHM
jgi:hypothetical protein